MVGVRMGHRPSGDGHRWFGWSKKGRGGRGVDGASPRRRWASMVRSVRMVQRVTLKVRMGHHHDAGGHRWFGWSQRSVSPSSALCLGAMSSAIALKWGKLSDFSDKDTSSTFGGHWMKTSKTVRLACRLRARRFAQASFRLEPRRCSKTKPRIRVLRVLGFTLAWCRPPAATPPDHCLPPYVLTC